MTCLQASSATRQKTFSDDPPFERSLCNAVETVEEHRARNYPDHHKHRTICSPFGHSLASEAEIEYTSDRTHSEEQKRRAPSPSRIVSAVCRSKMTSSPHR
ncbi:hypothetical protein H2248_002411 [Termitomyces sp. 'cryptogamus']|nr:hypothetical protein H2248_002411 [Termitomyces sp. 'cryptogamus']